jgi:peptidoglycan/xylan/chitin deacetylase (PgdA/CDA1 family)
MPFSPVRLGFLVVTAVAAGAIAAQTMTGSHPQPNDQAVAPPTARTQAAKPAGRQGVHPAAQAPATTNKNKIKANVRNSSKSRNVIFLTFDDGPSDAYTPAVLKLLAKYHAKATFFELGLQVDEFPHLVPQVKAAGHRIGNHTYDHKTLTSLPATKVRWEMEHGPKSRCFRPPGRETNPQIVALAASYGMRQVLWTVDTKDWTKPGTAAIENAILTGARPGAVILLHDGGGDRSQTIEALTHALPKLIRRGYVFESLDC